MKHLFSLLALATVTLTTASCTCPKVAHDLLSEKNTLICAPDCAHDSKATIPDSSVAKSSRWLQKIAIAKEKKDAVKILLIGDSITHFWDTKGRGLELFNESLAQYGALNIGISGYRTQQILWMVHNSELFSYIQPKLIVLMIGTNNLGWNETGPKETADAIKHILQVIRGKSPNSKILLYAVFQRGATADNKYRKPIDEINATIKNYADNKTIFFVDINNQFINPDDGTIPKSLMPDFLHPGKDGYVIWRDSMLPYIQKFVAPNSAPEKSFLKWW